VTVEHRDRTGKDSRDRGTDSDEVDAARRRRGGYRRETSMTRMRCVGGRGTTTACDEARHVGARLEHAERHAVEQNHADADPLEPRDHNQSRD